MPITKYQLILGESLLQRNGFCLDYAANSLNMQDPTNASDRLLVHQGVRPHLVADHVASVFAPPSEQDPAAPSVSESSPSTPDVILDDFDVAHAPDTTMIYFIRPVFEEGESRFDFADAAFGPATLERLADPT